MTADIMARWTPDENSGSTKQAASPTSIQPSPIIRVEVYDQSFTTLGAEIIRASESIWAVRSAERIWAW